MARLIVESLTLEVVVPSLVCLMGGLLVVAYGTSLFKCVFC